MAGAGQLSGARHCWSWGRALPAAAAQCHHHLSSVWCAGPGQPSLPASPPSPAAEQCLQHPRPSPVSWAAPGPDTPPPPAAGTHRAGTHQHTTGAGCALCTPAAAAPGPRVPFKPAAVVLVPVCRWWCVPGLCQAVTSDLGLPLLAGRPVPRRPARPGHDAFK